MRCSPAQAGLLCAGATHRCRALDALQAWLEDVSAFVKRLAPSQLLTTGSNGYFGASTPDLVAASTDFWPTRPLVRAPQLLPTAEGESRLGAGLGAGGAAGTALPAWMPATAPATHPRPVPHPCRSHPVCADVRGAGAALRCCL